MAHKGHHPSRQERQLGRSVRCLSRVQADAESNGCCLSGSTWAALFSLEPDQGCLAGSASPCSRAKERQTRKHKSSLHNSQQKEPESPGRELTSYSMDHWGSLPDKAWPRPWDSLPSEAGSSTNQSDPVCNSCNNEILRGWEYSTH